MLMEGTPKNVDMDEIIETIENVDGVHSIHDLHVWSITSGQNALSCHAVVDPDLPIRDCQLILKKLKRI